jgi:hypothetical protein
MQIFAPRLCTKSCDYSSLLHRELTKPRAFGQIFAPEEQDVYSSAREALRGNASLGDAARAAYRALLTERKPDRKLRLQTSCSCGAKTGEVFGITRQRRNYSREFSNE